MTSSLACSDRSLHVGAPRIEPEPSAMALRSAGAGAEPGPAALPAPRPRDASFRRGVTLGPLVAPESPEAFKRVQTKRLTRAVALGATDVRLLVRWTQTQPDAVELAPFDSIDDPLLGWLIDAARKRKLRVWLVPTVAVESTDGARPPSSVAPTSWDRWWWSYRRFVLHYAQVASSRKVPLLSVGNALSSTEGDAERWRALIKDVRKAYRGELSYIAGADSFERVGFWDAVDVTSIAVAAPTSLSEAALLERLAPLPVRLDGVQPKRAYLITEPDPGVELPDAEAALRRHRAVYRSFHDAPGLGGVFMNDAGDDAAKYEARGSAREPASASSSAEVLKYWFHQSRR